jgi:hypothetical protein
MYLFTIAATNENSMTLKTKIGLLRLRDFSSIRIKKCRTSGGLENK